MKITVNVESPIESINRAVMLLTEDTDAEIKVECTVYFFQRLIDTNELSPIYDIFSRTEESHIKYEGRWLRQYKHKNITFFEDPYFRNYKDPEAVMYLKDNKDIKIELTI